MAVQRETLGSAPNKEGYQFPLPIVPGAIDQTVEQSTEESHKRKIGLLTRILSGAPNGRLYRHIREIENNFKAGGTRTRVYPYRTNTGEQTVEATPEELRKVLGIRRIRIQSGHR